MRWSLVSLITLMLATTVLARHTGASEANDAAQLERIATTFNHEYSVNDVGPVWDRWDLASQVAISRDRYVLWHQECRVNPGPSTTLAAMPLKGGWWRVDYEISGVVLHDYWHRLNGKWRFSLVRSNPSALALYSTNYAHYARAMGCAGA